MNRRGTVLGLLLLGGVLGLVVSAQGWFTAAGTDAAGAASAAGGTVSFSGAEATGGLSQALAAVVVAGVLLTLVLARRGRQVVALLLAAVAVGMVAVGVLRTPPSSAAVRIRFRQTSLTDQFTLSATAWPWLYAVAGLLVMTGATLLWLASPRWQRRTRRFERSGAHDSQLPPVAVPDDPAGAWRALDAGLDPTLDGPQKSTSSDPDVRIGDEADRMAEGSSAAQDPPHLRIGDE